tara:strand:- start:971 stop:1528 length:558 start_codon:yes stop_codon:yes gene_type:complete
MPKDLKEIVQEETKSVSALSKNHRANFESLLQKELHNSKMKRFQILKVAASFLVLIGLGSSLFYFSKTTIETPKSVAKIESLGSISPEFKKIENYYLASIYSEISNLEETKENKELLDGYFEKIGELTKEYKLLTNELNTEGLNEKTIDALIDNLQLRLKLLYQLKEQLNDLQNLNISKNENKNI